MSSEEILQILESVTLRMAPPNEIGWVDIVFYIFVLSARTLRSLAQIFFENNYPG